MEPMGVVCCTAFHSPGTHTFGYLSSYASVDALSVFNGFNNSVVSHFREETAHLLQVKNILPKKTRYGFCFYAISFNLMG